jgi:hypothetical protein
MAERHQEPLELLECTKREIGAIGLTIATITGVRLFETTVPAS